MDPPTDGGLASAVLLRPRPPVARLDRGLAGALYGGAVAAAVQLAWQGAGQAVEAVVSEPVMDG